VVIANLYPGLYEIQAYPAADRIARGEEWLQTNTLDGGKPHELFVKNDEPALFQEFGPGNFQSRSVSPTEDHQERRTNSRHNGMCDPTPQWRRRCDLHGVSDRPCRETRT